MVGRAGNMEGRAKHAGAGGSMRKYAGVCGSMREKCGSMREECGKACGKYAGSMREAWRCILPHASRIPPACFSHTSAYFPQTSRRLPAGFPLTSRRLPAYFPHTSADSRSGSGCPYRLGHDRDPYRLSSVSCGCRGVSGSVLGLSLAGAACRWRTDDGPPGVHGGFPPTTPKPLCITFCP